MAQVEATVQFLGAHADALSILTRLRLFSQTAPRMQTAQRSRLARELLDALQNRLSAHHRDEEQVLFPAMLLAARSETELTTVETLIGSLISEHRSIETLWDQIQDQLLALADGQDVSLEENHCVDLVEIYAFHTEFEETVVLPLAASMLTDDDKEAVDLNLALRHDVHDLPAYI